MDSKSPICTRDLLQHLLGILNNIEEKTQEQETKQMAGVCLEIVWKLIENANGKTVEQIASQLPEGADFIAVKGIITEVVEARGYTPTIFGAGIPMFFGFEESFRTLINTIQDSIGGGFSDHPKGLVWLVSNIDTYGLELGILFPSGGKPILQSTLSTLCERIAPMLDAVVPNSYYTSVECPDKSEYLHKINIHFPSVLQPEE